MPHVSNTRARKIDTAAAPFTIPTDAVCHQTPLLLDVEQKEKHHPKTTDYYSDRRSGPQPANRQFAQLVYSCGSRREGPSIDTRSLRD